METAEFHNKLHDFNRTHCHDFKRNNQSNNSDLFLVFRELIALS